MTSAVHTQTSSTRPVVSVTTSSIAFATASASSTPDSTIKTASASPKMTPAQIAGLSVAAVAAFIMAIGLMALSICLRRRRERKSDSDEKSQGRNEKAFSTRFSHYVPVESGLDVSQQYSSIPKPPPTFGRAVNQRTARPVQRLGVGTSNSSSNSSLPLDQIGVAISAELDGKPLVHKKAANPGISQRNVIVESQPQNAPFRPVSTMTQETVFEEDEMPPQRISSVLLPMPPVPIPPIRALQPSRTVPKITTNNRQAGRRSELYLDIPIQHQRPQPKRIIAAENGSPQPATRPRLAPPFQMTSTATSYESQATTASSRDASTSGDIIDYYFSNNLGRDTTPKASPAHIGRPKESPKAVQVKSKKSHSSTLSYNTSRASTNIRDSLSSQTSFETMGRDSPTPEDEDDEKQLSDDSSSNKQQLSPVAESPISNLRYPKVPRASNQLVPRSPKSPPHHIFNSPRRGPDPSNLLQKRNNALPPLLLESRPRLNSPHRDPFTSPPRITSPLRKVRSHVRSNSTESWSTTPASKTGIDRKSRVQSGAWGKSPVMYEEDVVRPLNVRRKRDEMSELNIGRDVDVDGLASPVWIPKLTPRKKGEDLFLEVGWGNPARR
ncbi:transketolase [Pyrenophora seminiperda CCB06]|uniref:Transketolase n=1 Tax=Pyrenophora seminiperda CCB06 TaxID=1302712 RepID=A0A3M7M9R5_9PLEO|nr:transketolase [Pyrenophora seminiperda CCB06]